MAVSIYSMMINASPNYHYDLILLSTDLGPYMKKNLLTMLKQFPNCHLRFLNVTPYLSGKKFKVNGTHISKETFYRLLVPDLFFHYDRIIYLDSDLIIQADISELYKLDMGQNLIAASIDPHFVGEYNGGTESVKVYCDETLKLENPYAYFQAGVLVFHTKNMCKCFEPGELIEYAQKNSFLYVDQDVLNVKCAGKVKFIGIKWNVMVDCASIRIKQFISHAPVNLYHEYMEARKSPAIIHYAGFEKPWNSPLSDFADIFWQYARQTLFYEAIVFRMGGNTQPEIPDNRSAARKLADKLLPKGTRRREIAKKILPKGSRRWKFSKRIYRFLSSNTA